MIQSPSRFVRPAALLSVVLTSLAQAEPGDRKRIGGAGEWQNTVAVATLKNNLYSVESDGTLYSTDLKTGKWKPLGKSKYPGTKFLCTAGNSLYVSQGDGSVFRVNPATGLKQRLGAAGVWKNVIKATSLSGGLYSVTSKGALYSTNTTTGRWTKIGKDEFGGTVLMLNREKVGYATAGLFTIEGDGSLYEVKASDGTWKNVGKPELWKGSKAGAIIGEADTIYVVNANGTLQWSILAAGDDVKPLPMGKPIYKSTKFLFVGHDGPMPTLYCLDADGSLYAIEMAPMVG